MATRAPAKNACTCVTYAGQKESELTTMSERHTQQPEALRLADDLDSTSPQCETWQVSAELRRLHARVQELEALRVMHMEAVCAVHGKACGAACNCPRVAMARMSDGTLRHQDPIEQPRTMGLPAEIPDSDLLWRCLTHGYTKAAVEAMLSEHDKQVLQERATKAWAEIVNEVQQKGGGK